MFLYRKLIIVLFLFITPFFAHAAGSCSASGLSGGGSLSQLIPGGLAGEVVPVAEEGDVKDFIKITTNKECFLDGIASKLSRDILEGITGDVLKYTTTGFDGNPAYVEDLNVYWNEIADKAAEDFINGDEIGGMCNGDLVRQAIAQDYYGTFAEGAACTADKEYSDEFTSWNDWSQQVVFGVNDIYSQLFVVQDELNKRVYSAVDEAQKETDYGGGYLSQRECDGTEEEGEDCSITTPSSTTRDTAQNIFDSPVRQLELADEIDEIIDVLLSQLSTKILGRGGLSGLGRSRGGKTSYISSLQSGNNNDDISRDRNDTIAFINSVESIERRYKEVKVETMTILENSESLLTTLIDCHPTSSTSTTEILESEIIPKQITVQSDIDESDIILAQLNDARTRATLANNTSTLKNIIFEIETLSTHGYVDLIEAEQSKEDRQSEMAILDEETNEKLSSLCQL